MKGYISCYLLLATDVRRQNTPEDKATYRKF